MDISGAKSNTSAISQSERRATEVCSPSLGLRPNQRPLTFQVEPITSRAMSEEILQKLRCAIRDVPDFPKPGIIFKDITPVLCDGVLFRAAIDLFRDHCRGKQIDKIVCIDARGFLFGSAVAYELGIGLVPIRK